MSSTAVANQFNAAINARDLDALVGLMAEDHAFVDPAGSRVEGKGRCREIWASFFDAFPDYRNHFDSLVERDGLVIIAGRSECSHAELAGPALWTARVRDGRVSEWRVYDDTPAMRSRLGIPCAS